MRRLLPIFLAVCICICCVPVQADTSVVIPVALCCSGDVYAVDYVFRVTDDAVIRAVQCSFGGMLEWNHVESEARLYISLASAYAFPSAQSILSITAETDISLQLESIMVNGIQRDDAFPVHAETEIRGAVKETCTDEGYTGDTWCLDCETKLKSGTVIPAIGSAEHLWGEWVIVEDSAVRTCTRCSLTDSYTAEKMKVSVSHTTQEQTVSVNVIITEENIEILLDAAELETKLDTLVQENTQSSGVIVVDVASLTQALEEVEALNHVSIPTTAFTKLEEAAESSSVNAIEVQLTDGSVKFADEALSVLSGTEGGSVDVHLSKIEEDVETVLAEQIGNNPQKQTALETLKTEATILGAVSVAVVDAGTREEIHDFSGNAESTKANVTITIEFELGSHKAEGLRVYDLTDDGECKEYIPTYSDGKLLIEVPYLSTFIVGYNAAVPLYPLGDANHDGKADSSDAVAILRKLAGYEVPNFHENTADFNGDGKADSSDAVAILRKLAGY